MSELRDALTQVVRSVPYRAWARLNPTDASKVTAELAGTRRPRPGSAYAQGLVRLARLAQTPPAPKPTPAPAADPRLAFWRSTGVWTAWGIRNSQYADLPAFARWAKSKGFTWVAIEDDPAALAKRDSIFAALRSEGLKVVLWQTRPITASGAVSAITYWNPDGYIAEIEVEPEEGAAIVARRVREAFTTLPLGIATNFSGAGAKPDGTYDRALAKPWIDNGWACMPEAYIFNELGQQPTLAPDNLDWVAKDVLGFPETFPLLGVFRCPPSTYDPYLARFPHHAWYLAEYMTP